MKNRQTFFFAEIEDMLQILEHIEAREDIHYYETGLFDTSNTNHHSSLLTINGLGHVDNGDWNQTKSFLIIPSSGASLKHSETCA